MNDTESVRYCRKLFHGPLKKSGTSSSCDAHPLSSPASALTKCKECWALREKFVLLFLICKALTSVKENIYVEASHKHSMHTYAPMGRIGQSSNLAKFGTCQTFGAKFFRYSAKIRTRVNHPRCPQTAACGCVAGSASNGRKKTDSRRVRCFSRSALPWIVFSFGHPALQSSVLDENAIPSKVQTGRANYADCLSACVSEVDAVHSKWQKLPAINFVKIEGAIAFKANGNAIMCVLNNIVVYRWTLQRLRQAMCKESTLAPMKLQNWNKTLVSWIVTVFSNFASERMNMTLNQLVSFIGRHKGQ